MIKFHQVSKEYPTSGFVLKDISLKIEPREFVSIVGTSGAGKTTLLKLLLAEEKPTSGNVFFESTDVHALRRNEINKLRLRNGKVYQDFRLLPHKTAY